MADDWGPRLHAFLEAHWAALGTNANAWAGPHGLNGATLSRWKTGETTPKLEAMIAVAEALGVPVSHVLVAVGVIDDAEAYVPPAPSIDVAIANDPTLSDWERPRIREYVEALRQVRPGGTVQKVRKRL